MADKVSDKDAHEGTKFVFKATAKVEHVQSPFHEEIYRSLEEAMAAVETVVNQHIKSVETLTWGDMDANKEGPYCSWHASVSQTPVFDNTTGDGDTAKPDDSQNGGDQAKESTQGRSDQRDKILCAIHQTPVREEVEKINRKINELLHRKNWMMNLYQNHEETPESGIGASGSVDDVKIANDSNGKSNLNSESAAPSMKPALKQSRKARPKKLKTRNEKTPRSTKVENGEATKGKSSAENTQDASATAGDPKASTKKRATKGSKVSRTKKVLEGEDMPKKKEKKIKSSWSKQEETALRIGVERYGMGKWASIANDADFKEVLKNRSTVDFKDKWRNLLKKARMEERKRQDKENDTEQVQKKPMHEPQQPVVVQEGEPVAAPDSSHLIPI